MDVYTMLIGTGVKHRDAKDIVGCMLESSEEIPKVKSTESAGPRVKRSAKRFKPKNHVLYFGTQVDEERASLSEGWIMDSCWPVGVRDSMSLVQ